MRPCPNCGQDAPLSDRFCPHCGSALPWGRTAPAPAPSPPSPPPDPRQAYVTPAPPQQAYAAPAPPPVQGYAYAPPVQPQRQQAPDATYSAQPPYADPNAYTPVYGPTGAAPGARAGNTPAYVDNGVYGGNLPAPRVQQAPTPIAPIRGADPALNTLLDLGRSLGATDTRGLLRLAAIVFAAIVALVVAFKVVSFFLSLLPVLLLVAAIVVAWQYRRYRRVRRRVRP